MNTPVKARVNRGRSVQQVIPIPDTQMPPHSTEAEEGVLGSVLYDPSTFAKVKDIVSAGDFWHDDHQLVYRAMVTVDKNGDAVEPIAVHEQLKQYPGYDFDQFAYLLAKLAKSVPHSANAALHANTVAKKARRRAHIAKLRDALSAVYSPEYSDEEVAEKTEAAVQALRPSRQPEEECRIRAWPDSPAEEAWHGLAGKVVGLIRPHTEADPVAVLMQFLVTFSNVIGRNAHWTHGDSRHSLNLFAVIVGNSAMARKGTSWEATRGFFKRCVPEYVATRIKHGLSSGEGLIDQVRDPQVKNGQIIDQGVSDKRLLVIEQEFGSTLSVMARDGNNLCGTVRIAWESGDLSSLSKKCPVAATGAHISIIGHATESDLARHLSQTEIGNGFANRFLWVCAKRSALMPFSAPFDLRLLEPVVRKLREAIEFGSTADLLNDDPMTMTDAARSLWIEQYEILSEPKGGMLGAITVRGAAQVRRMACLYALLDGCWRVDAVHLKAAYALWRYCEQSAAYIFGEAISNPESDRLLRAIKDAGKDGLSRKRITGEVFGKNKTSDEIALLLLALQKDGLIQSSMVKTGGRPSEVWTYSRVPTH